AYLKQVAPSSPSAHTTERNRTSDRTAPAIGSRWAADFEIAPWSIVPARCWSGLYISPRPPRIGEALFQHHTPPCSSAHRWVPSSTIALGSPRKGIAIAFSTSRAPNPSVAQRTP